MILIFYGKSWCFVEETEDFSMMKGTLNQYAYPAKTNWLLVDFRAAIKLGVIIFNLKVHHPIKKNSFIL